MSGEGRHFGIEDGSIDILVHGYPGKSVCHGSLGWSTIALIRRGARTALVDVGSFGQRKLLLERLAAHGLEPKDVTDLLLSHSHHDHAINWTMFPEARIVIADAELDWALEQPWGVTPVPELYVEKLEHWPTLHRAADGEEVFPGVRAHLTPGHTPGSAVYVLDAGGHDVVFTGDACKNRSELLTRSADMSYDPAVSRASIEAIWGYWTARPGGILVPGHDLPMLLENGAPRYLGEREAAIRAWYGEDLNQTTLISLLPDSAARQAAE